MQQSTIINLANVELSGTERDVLCRGLRFGIPPRIQKEKVQAEFELYYQQLLGCASITTEKEQEC